MIGRELVVGGGHAPGAGRRATSEFPPGWTNEQIIAVIKDVANDPGEPRRRQYNGRWRCAGERYGVHVVVLVEEDGMVHTAFPIAGPGVTRNPDTAKDPANPTVADLAAGRISYFADVLLAQLANRLPQEDFDHYRGLLWSGEWDELVDTMIAHLCAENVRLTVDEYADLERLLNTYELPLEGYVFLNDRDHILTQLRPRAARA
ncbi:EndoU nuclease [Amycolatopsis xylanica]|uniref:EndoU nuclease n=1 Tax=Amycolatopsis xylanica TaxID=589385 RepID=A0A1H3AFY7_9PSEU|nr:EndoU nuclease [Amycolatopsis xylanica]